MLSCVCTGFFLHGTLSFASLSSPTPSTPGWTFLFCPPQAYLWSLPSHPTLLFTCHDLGVSCFLPSSMKLWQKNLLTGKQSKISDSSWILTEKKDHQVQIPSQTLPNADTQYFTSFSRLSPMVWLTANIPREEKKKLSHRERKRTQEHNSKDIVESIPWSHKLKKWQHIRVWYYPRQMYYQIIILIPHFCSG